MKLGKILSEINWFSTLMVYLKVTRVESWLGWIFSFGFGSIILGLPSLKYFLIALFAFSLATASVFILNQYFDRKEDQGNAFKSNLPVASGKIAPQTALILSFSLVILCLFLVSLIDSSLVLLFLIYIAIWTAYSVPPLRLKTVPIVDFVTSGIGAGFMPFLMGLELTDKLSSNVLLILLGAVPLMLIHCSGHVIQAIGDYEVDHKMGIHTFVVRYGRKNGTIVAGFMFILACFTPLVYSIFGLLPYKHLFLFFVFFPLAIPIIKCYADVLKEPTTKNVICLQKTATKYGIIWIAVTLGYLLLVKILGF